MDLANAKKMSPVLIGLSRPICAVVLFGLEGVELVGDAFAIDQWLVWTLVRLPQRLVVIAPILSAFVGMAGTEMQKALFWNGCHVKFTGDTGIVAPPFIAERAHVDEIVDKLRKTMDQMAG